MRLDNGENMSLSPIESKWRTDFLEYQQLVELGFREAVLDAAKMDYLQKKYPNADMPASLRASIEMFWGENDGWANKKAKRVKQIDMKMTLIRSVDAGRNLVMRNQFAPKYQPPKPEPVKQEKETPAENYKYSHLDMAIVTKLMGIPNMQMRMVRLNQHHNGLQKAIDEDKVEEFLDRELASIKIEYPELFGEKPVEVGRSPVVSFDAVEKARAFAKQYAH